MPQSDVSVSPSSAEGAGSTQAARRPRRLRTPIRKQRVSAMVAVGAIAGVAAGFALPGGAAAAPDPKPVTPVPSLDVQRYLGDWKQIAAIPQWFEALCERDVTANYKATADGGVAVKNVCKGPFGASIVANGKARVLDTATNAQLQVSFLNVFGQWYYPDRTPNYVVVGLGANYDWAVVGDPARRSAFVLSRTATLSAEARAGALAALDRTGFDASKLEVTRQTGGATTKRPFSQG